MSKPDPYKMRVALERCKDRVERLEYVLRLVLDRGPSWDVEQAVLNVLDEDE